MTEISVIIPTRNRPDYLQDAVASVMAQSLQDLEIIIVNDGDSPLPQFSDKRITIVDNHRHGHVPARNNGIRHASGNLIAFLDDDDAWIDDGHLARAAKLIARGADFTFADGIMKFPGETNARHFAMNATAESLSHDNTILISAVCYRKSLHDRLGQFDEALPYYWDWDWYLRVARAPCTIIRDDHLAVNIRIHASNMSSPSNRDARAENLARLARKHKIGPLTLKNHTDFVD